MKTDGGLWEQIRDHMRLFHWTRIETGGTGRGIPDLVGCVAGITVWCELKQTSGWTPGISPEQVGWAERHLRSGGRVVLMTRRQAEAGPRRGPAVDELWVHSAWRMRDVVLGGLRAAAPLIQTSGGPSQWDWPGVTRAITRGAL